ncbi:hypothetical protein GUA46_02585 [Muricauda sp. HICW]|uniref:Uncharacterized protein n=1 Tax=Flagellimonas chongwuensis TaxID=2697365 RepID=A0A850NBC6_9FLAO|nr:MULTISPECIES: hypothetical protein [Allomuricauda]NVN17214.1 hypothetical protein [Allomuricauda chongwuensis]
MKTLLFPIISLLLIFALSVSPIVPLLDKELGKTMIIGAAEEEKSSKTITIKKFDEADTFYKYFFESHNQHFSQDSSMGYLGYIFPFSDYTVEILDPPPRNLV